MSRRFVVAATIVALSVLSPSALLGQQAPPPAGHHGPLPKPVNLKVLPKDTTPDQLIKIMRGFSQQLGVHCNFCHSEGTTPGHMDFASDAKPEKNTARTMMLMSHEINDKYMSQIHDPDAAPDQRSVRCSTCHQGHSMPVTFTPPEHPPAPPKP